MAQTKVGEQQQDGDKMQSANKAQAAGGKVKPSYKHIPHSQKPPHLVAKRNARERRRVQAVNQAFYKLRKSVPIENRNKRVSKVKTLQRAIDYIRKLEMILAEDEAQGGSDSSIASGALLHLQQAGSKLHQEACPLQQNTMRNNSSSCKQNEPPPQPTSETNSDKPAVTTSTSELQMENDVSKASRAVKERPKRLDEFDIAGEIEAMTKKQQENDVFVASTSQKQRRGRKPNSSKQLTGDVHQNDDRRNGHQQQLAREHRGGLDGTQNDGNYGALKPTITSGSVESARATTATTTTPITSKTATATSSYCRFNAGVSYGRPRESTPTLVAAPTATNHYPNHNYHYYAESPVSTMMTVGDQQQHQFAYVHHLQFPLDGQQQPHGSLGGENPSSSTMATNGPSVCNYAQASHHYGVINSNCSSLPLDSATQVGNINQQDRPINHGSYLASVDSSSSLMSNQQRYLAPAARHHQQSNTWYLHHHQQEQQQTAVSASDKVNNNATRIGAHFSPLPMGGANSFRQEKPVIVAATQSCPADSTSSSATSRTLPNHKPTLNAGSPPVSICSSSSLSPSTTFKSLDLSGSGSSTNGSLFGVGGANCSGSAKSPTTTTATGTTVVCRQSIGNGDNSNLDNGAHSTTTHDYRNLQPQQANNRQQQVNSYSSQLPAYAAHLSYEAPSSGGGDYHTGSRLQQQQQPDEQRATKLIGGVQNKSQSTSSLHAGAAAVGISELQHRAGSRSSSVVSPLPERQQQQQQQQQLTLVGGNYLTNNNLHGNNQHSAQLFQQQSTYYQRQQHLHHQQLSHHHDHHQQQQQQQSLYQGHHFLGNQHGQQQQQTSSHLSDHHNHHLQSESSPSELRQPNANTIELVTTTSIHHHQQQPSPSDRLVLNGSSTATILAPTQQHYTVLPL